MMITALLLVAQSIVLGPEPMKVPAIDEGWVFPLEQEQRASSVCPVIGRLTAEFVIATPHRSFKVRGLRRASTKEDEQKIIRMLQPLGGWQSIDVSCWGHQVFLISVYGPQVKGRPGKIDFLWTSRGPEHISPNALYPSVPSSDMSGKPGRRTGS